MTLSVRYRMICKREGREWEWHYPTNTVFFMRAAAEQYAEGISPQFKTQVLTEDAAKAFLRLEEARR